MARFSTLLLLAAALVVVQCAHIVRFLYEGITEDEDRADKDCSPLLKLMGPLKLHDSQVRRRVRAAEMGNRHA